ARKSRRLEQLPHSKSEIRNHNDRRLSSLRCSSPRLWIQQLCVGPNNFRNNDEIVGPPRRWYLSAIGVVAHELLERFPFAAPGRLRRPARVRHVGNFDLRAFVHAQ
ncbi:MAG TPA: hypothetical protein VJ248_04450, partial [Candidatus Udaeobacter sp.]|nr:hypothetical protein [Candidatus Udaeobacter sp.]